MSADQDQAPTKMRVPTFDELSDFVKTALEKVAREQRFINFQLNCTSGANVGDGYMGIMLHTTIKGTKTEGSNKMETLNVLVKMPPKSKARRKQFATDLVFEREILMYTKYFPLLMKYQKEKGIKPEDGFNNFPKCYYGGMDIENGEAAIIMEDLRESGYKLANKLKPLDFEYIRLVLENIGRFHALSFALKKQHSEIYDQFKFNDLMSKLFEYPGREKVWDEYTDYGISTLKPNEISLKQKFEKYNNRVLQELKKLLNGNAAEPYTILTHGGNIPKRIKFIDFQIACYASPVIDLVYFIFSSTDKAFRDKYYEELLTIYYDSLSKLLKQLGENPDIVFPFEALQQQLKKFGSYGMLTSFMLIPTLAVGKSDVPDMNENSEIIKQPRADGNTEIPEEGKEMFSVFMLYDETVATRTRDVILDMNRLGYI